MYTISPFFCHAQATRYDILSNLSTLRSLAHHRTHPLIIVIDYYYYRYHIPPPSYLSLLCRLILLPHLCTALGPSQLVIIHSLISVFV